MHFMDEELRKFQAVLGGLTLNQDVTRFELKVKEKNDSLISNGPH